MAPSDAQQPYFRVLNPTYLQRDSLFRVCIHNFHAAVFSIISRKQLYVYAFLYTHIQFPCRDVEIKTQKSGTCAPMVHVV